MRFASVGLAAMLALAGLPARAEVVAKAENGFVVRVAARTTAAPIDAWKTLVVPATWWSAQHTFSGDAANLTLDPVPGGCFCEKLPLPKDEAKGERPGGVQHLRVVYANPYKALRLNGALGPLQSEALQGTLTITIKPMDAGSRILFEYVVGGFMRYPVDEIAPAVDKMLSAQLAALATKLGPMASTPAESPPDPVLAPPPPPPSQGDVAPQGWSLPPRPGTKSSPAPAVVPPAKPEPVPRSASKPAPRSKPASAATEAPTPAQQERDEANAAFDALLGDGAEPPSNR